jgi:hypothetical protein
MKAEQKKLILATGIVSLLGLAFCGVASAQAPAGPVAAPPQPTGAPAVKPRELPPPPSPRQNILGAWVLNRDESDDPRKRTRVSQDSGGGYGGRRGGVGWPGSGGGGYGGHRGGMGGGESDEERAKMHELLSPPTNITFSMTGAEVDLKDDRERKRAFMTDGRKLQKSKDDNYQEIAAKWDGNHLVTDEKNPRGGKMSRTFELSPDGRQLYETLSLKMGRSNTETSFRFVYDMPTQTAQQ